MVNVIRAAWITLFLVGCGGPIDSDGGTGDGGRDSRVSFTDGRARDTFDPDVRDTRPPFDGGPPIFERRATFSHNQDDPPGECVETMSRFGCNSTTQTGGAAIADITGDGLPDIYFTKLDGPDLLYINQGGGMFREEGAAWGLTLDAMTTGAVFADVDGDGDHDLYVTTYGGDRHLLYINEGSSFREDGVARGVALTNTVRPIQGASAAFGDYDGDGWLDLFVAEWIFEDDLLVEEPDATGLRSRSRLLHNVGDGVFEDVTVAAGVSVDGLGTDGTYPLSANFVDFDEDGRPDLAITGDFFSSRLFWNDGDGTFTDGTEAAGVGTDANGMGAAFGDVDNDGDIDWAVTSVSDPRPPYMPDQGNRLYLYEGARTFREVSSESDIRYTDWAWGIVFFDFDHDGDLDSAVTNGYFSDGRSRLLRNDEGRFNEIGEHAQFDVVAQGRGLYTLDADNDGDMDVLLTRSGDQPILYENIFAQDAGPSVRIRLEQPGSNNFFAIGARVAVTGGGRTQIKELYAGSEFLGQSEGVLHFGMGVDPSCPVEVSVRWPDGTIQSETDVPCRETVTITRE